MIASKCLKDMSDVLQRKSFSVTRQESETSLEKLCDISLIE